MADSIDDFIRIDKIEASQLPRSVELRVYRYTIAACPSVDLLLTFRTKFLALDNRAFGVASIFSKPLT